MLKDSIRDLKINGELLLFGNIIKLVGSNYIIS